MNTFLLAVDTFCEISGKAASLPGLPGCLAAWAALPVSLRGPLRNLYFRGRAPDSGCAPALGAIVDFYAVRRPFVDE